MPTTDMLAQITAEHYGALLKQRFAIFTLYVFIFTSLSVGVYFATLQKEGICNNSAEKMAVLISMGLLMFLITVIFGFLFKKINFQIKISRDSLVEIEGKMGSKDAIRVFTKEKEYLCFSHSGCFYSLLTISVLAYILLLVFIWNPPLKCQDKQLPDMTEHSGNRNSVNIYVDVRNK